MDFSFRTECLNTIMDFPDKQDCIEIYYRNHSIFRLDIHRDLTYLCAVTFKNNDYGKRKSKQSINSFIMAGTASEGGAS